MRCVSSSGVRLAPRDFPWLRPDINYQHRTTNALTYDVLNTLSTSNTHACHLPSFYTPPRSTPSHRLS